MENGLIIGYDFSKDCCRISYFKEGADEPADLAFSDEANPYLIQNSICKRKGRDEWLVGHEAYETALLGGGSIVDKLLFLMERKGFSTFDGVRYSSEELFKHYLQCTLDVLFQKEGTSVVREIVFTVQTLNEVVLDTIISTCKSLGMDRKHVHIISHTEGFLYYAISAKRELWSNISALVDFSGEGLNFYEMKVLRGIQPNAAIANHKLSEESIPVDILETPKGYKMADSIVCTFAEKELKDKLVSSCYLSGSGMDNCQTWGERFLKMLCQRRRVFFVENIFAKGAVYAAMEQLREESIYPFRIMCEGRIRVDILCDVYKGASQQTVVLAKAGANWYETKADFDIIPDQESVLRLKVTRFGERTGEIKEIPMKDILEGRANRMTRIGVSLKFTSENSIMVALKDKGFGEFIPAKDTVIYRTFTV